MRLVRPAEQDDLFSRPKTGTKAGVFGIPRDGAPIIVCYGGGVDSTAMLIALKRNGIVPDLIMFADTGGEKPETYDYVRALDDWLTSWGAPAVTWVARKPSPRVGYKTLEGNCLDNETLPSLAFGLNRAGFAGGILV